jgi:L-alanine-DL-glutamate epimerase-like enolase superfamily enzyme
MQITSVDVQLLELPLARPIVAAATSGKRGAAGTSIFMPVVSVETDEGLSGLGYAWSVRVGGRAMLTTLRDDLVGVLIGEDPLDHERLWQKMYWQTQSIGRHGLVIQAQSALDLALWDLKGKAAGQPLYKLLGGLRQSAPIYGSDGGWLNMSVDEMLKAADEYLSQGMRGIKLKVGHDDPLTDRNRVRQVREALGPDTWIAVDANQKWDYPTALRMGREFEQLGCIWYEEPMICADVVGHARLATKLDIPIALGETLGSRYEIDAFLRANAVDIVQPDLTRVGGITEFLKVAVLASTAGRPVEPHLMMEASVHLACALPGVEGLEYMPWLTPAFAESPRLENGELVVPDAPGLGLEISPKAMEQYRVA